MLKTAPPNKSFGRALIALHRSSADDGLFAYAAMLARQGIIREPHFVHVVPARDPAAADPRPEAIIGEMRTAAEPHFAGVQRRYDVRSGPLLDQLLAHAAEEQIELILIGHRKDHPLRRSLARRLATKAPCSVWLVPEGSAASVSRVLVPIDFSPRSADSLAMGCVVAAHAGVSQIQALHVYFDDARTTYEDADAVIRGHEADTFTRFLAPIDTCGVTVSPRFEAGSHPADTIVCMASELGSDLIVLETRGRTASAAILLGSVAEETLTHSSVPVLVVKHFGARLGVLQALLDRTFHRGSGLQFD